MQLVDRAHGRGVHDHRSGFGFQQLQQARFLLLAIDRADDGETAVNSRSTPP